MTLKVNSLFVVSVMCTYCDQMAEAIKHCKVAQHSAFCAKFDNKL